MEGLKACVELAKPCILFAFLTSTNGGPGTTGTSALMATFDGKIAMQMHCEPDLHNEFGNSEDLVIMQVELALDSEKKQRLSIPWKFLLPRTRVAFGSSESGSHDRAGANLRREYRD